MATFRPKLAVVTTDYATLGKIRAGKIVLPTNVSIDAVAPIDGTYVTVTFTGSGLDSWAVTQAVAGVLSVSSSSGVEVTYSALIGSSGA